MDRPVVKELIQEEMNTQNIIAELRRLIYDKETRNRLQQDYSELRNLLSQGGNASEKAASRIVDFVKGQRSST
jgi:lipid-A-disaccharide synthase